MINRFINKQLFSTIGSNLHQSQKQTLDQRLILVDKNDKITGDIDKLTAHRNDYIFSEQGEAHRAFSVFLFNEKNQLLLHKRSNLKMTFPLFWTNTCCSHPLFKEDEIKQEQGCKLAAQRRVDFELNIKVDSIDEFKLVDKFLYKAESYDGWGEYELDYVFFLRKSLKEVNPNIEEIEEIAWVEKDQLQQFLNEKQLNKNEKTTPWFQKIIDNKLMMWWDKLEKNELQELTNIEKINQNIPFL